MARASAARARALLGGRHPSLTLMIRSDQPENARMAELVRRDLARVGIRLEIRSDPEDGVIANDPREGIDILALGWLMDIADPANAVTEIVAPHREPFFPVPRADAPTPAWRQDARARPAGHWAGPLTRVRSTRPESQCGRRATRRLRRSAGPAEFFAKRVGCVTFLSLWGGLADLSSLCLRS